MADATETTLFNEGDPFKKLSVTDELRNLLWNSLCPILQNVTRLPQDSENRENWIQNRLQNKGEKVQL